LHAARGGSGRTEQCAERAQNCRSLFIRRHDLHRENDQGSILSGVASRLLPSSSQEAGQRAVQVTSRKKYPSKQQDKKFNT
jgi:hypothetical protein